MKAIFYASSTGNTEEVANKIHEKLNDFELIDISQDGISKMNDCNFVIIGSSTWGVRGGIYKMIGKIVLMSYNQLNLKKKTVAFFGLGDQDGYGDEFADAIGILYEVISEKGAKIVGHTSIDGYDFDNSRAVVDGEFIGLVIDEDNQSELTDERIENWCKENSKFF